MLSFTEQKFYYFYFLIHIPITVFVDSSVVFPQAFQLAPRLVNWHISRNNDFLLQEKPAWLWWFIVVELVFQLPFFLFITRRFVQLWKLTFYGGEESKPMQFQLWRIMAGGLRLYGLNASLTTLMCLWAIWSRGYYPATGLPMALADKAKLSMLYVPYFLIPLRLVFV
ncbi:AaceriAFR508Wp [[Ashbya] aceris (nom. inval.)]|nr:AaceriAFR508Wp [[Ashbya] aceris (nom. inval.)]